jgi:hypothetical protein
MVGGLTPLYAPNNIYPSNTNTPAYTLCNPSDDLVGPRKIVCRTNGAITAPPNPSNLFKIPELLFLTHHGSEASRHRAVSREWSQPPGPDIEALAHPSHYKHPKKQGKRKGVEYCHVFQHRGMGIESGSKVSYRAPVFYGL